MKPTIKEYFAQAEAHREFRPGRTRIPLNVPSFGEEEVCEALDSMLTTRVTMGEKVAKFEELFARYIGMKYAIMVNSGSSANLLALSILTSPSILGKIGSGSRIITPAVTWSTTVFPIAFVGLVPKLVDVEVESMTMDPALVKRAVSPETAALLPVHLMGFPCNMTEIVEMASAKGIYVIEDACEAHGAEVLGRKVGSFGDISTFSFFFSHHITTIEGGMILTNNEEYSNLARSLRAHGWIRERSDKKEIAKRYLMIDPRFLFISPGFNVRPTEIQGAFGIHQIRKLSRELEARRTNAQYWSSRFSKFWNIFILPVEKPGTKSAWFGYPMTVKPGAPFSRNSLVAFLESKGIETRPIMAGNMAEQPVMQHLNYDVHGDLKNARMIMRNSFFFGNHSGIGKEEKEYIADCVEEFARSKLKRNVLDQKESVGYRS